MQECSDGVVAGFRSGRIRAEVDDLLLYEDAEWAEVCRCIICLLIYSEPVATHCCGSIFCKECIATWLRKRAVCPTCDKPLDHSSITSVLRQSKATVDLLEVHCPHAHDGCSFTFRYGSLKQHLKACTFAKVACPYACFGCPTIAIPRWRLSAHLLNNAHLHSQFEANTAQVGCAREIMQPERLPQKDTDQQATAGTPRKMHSYLKEISPREDNWNLAKADANLVASMGRTLRSDAHQIP